LLALAARANLEESIPLVVDLGREQEFQRVIPENGSIRELYQGKPVVKYLERGFLASPIQKMSDDQDRLAFAFGAKISKSVLCLSHTRELAAGAGSDRRHRSTSREYTNLKTSNIGEILASRQAGHERRSATWPR
jgi:hypothetical protein